MNLPRPGVGRLPARATYSLLLLADFDDPQIGEQVLAQAEGLTDRGLAVTVAGSLTRREQDRLGRRLIRWARLELAPEPRDPGRRQVAEQLRRLLASRPLELVHAHGYLPLTVAVGAGAGRAPVPPRLVASLYSVPRPSSPWARWRERRSLRPLMLACSRVLLSSHADREALTALTRPLADRTEILYPTVLPGGRPSGVETGLLRRRLGLSGHAAVIGLSTTFTERDYEVFLEAAGQVQADLPNLEFAFLGDGPLRQVAEQAAHQAGLGGACIFLGRPRSVIEALSVLNALVVLSDAGAAHLHALQALAFGMPVIATRVGALSELLEPVPLAHLVAPGDVAGLARALTVALHALPSETNVFDHEGEAGRTPTIEQFLVSRDYWDLDQPWTRGATRPVVRQAALTEGLARYQPEVVLDRLLEIYSRVLTG